MIVEDSPVVPPLLPTQTSFVADPVFADTVEMEYAPVALHGPTAGPNRYTVHVPSETTRLSLGEASANWVTDVGITGYTDSHVHFETKVNDKTVVSLGGPATTTGIVGHLGHPPKDTHGYSMVTEQLAWHDAQKQHYLVSHTGDISLRSQGGTKRAVVQADAGHVDLNGGKEVNLSGGGVSIGAHSGLTMEDIRYGGTWTGAGPHSTAAGGTRIAVAVATALTSLHDLIAHRTWPKYEGGKMAPTPTPWMDRAKWVINAVKLGLAVNKVVSLASAPEAPPDCVKLDAENELGASAGSDIGCFGFMGVSLGSALFTSVSAGVSASLKATLFGGVGGGWVSLKGYRKVEMGSDWGDILLGAKKNVEMKSKTSFVASAKKTAQVVSPGYAGLYGGKTKTWMGTKAGGAWGLLCDDKGLALGQAEWGDKMIDAKMKEAPALTINNDGILLKNNKGGGRTGSALTLDANLCKLDSPKIAFDSSGSVTVNGAKILLKP